MSRVCYTTACPVNSCCDSYAYCAYNLPIQFCYSYIQYYSQNYWWVYFTVSMVLLIIMLSVLGGVRRRRAMLARQNDIVMMGNTSPSYVQGTPVYGDTVVTGMPVDGGIGDELVEGDVYMARRN